ncbi:PREDICTED: uncharacterized protein LOC109233645 [Nicotiana attenuata]|uniref:uncharacterized protein LOC109233645 n=1 Tax=Nicotiana attenuata TaxID=49451 RepID=UPI000905D75A|nr:PREDICTED: uncharacterized protein LOC109233645 [Nicotiana attenuata]
MPETSPVFEDQKEDSEEDSDDLQIASLPRHRVAVGKEPTPKRPTPRLQKKEAFEYAQKNNQTKSKRRKLVKDGKVVNEKIVSVVNVDEEEAEEPRERVCKTAKRKVDTDEEPGSSKKAKVGNLGSARKEILRSQKTHLFASDATRVYEKEVQSFYADYKVEDGHICALVNGVDMEIDSSLRGSILGVPTEGLSNVQGACTQNFRNTILKDRAIQWGERVQKKALLPFYQLLFEMVNKVLLPRAGQRSITSRADLFLMEALDNFTTINLPVIMIEHMNKVADFKDGNHGLLYGFLLPKDFENFKVPLRPVKVCAKKQKISKGTLEECECIEKFGEVASTSTISHLINAQNSATIEIRKVKARNAILETQISQLQEAPSSSCSQSEEVGRLTKEKAELRKQVEEVKERLLNEQMSANGRMDFIL